MENSWLWDRLALPGWVWSVAKAHSVGEQQAEHEPAVTLAASGLPSETEERDYSPTLQDCLQERPPGWAVTEVPALWGKAEGFGLVHPVAEVVWGDRGSSLQVPARRHGENIARLFSVVHDRRKSVKKAQVEMRNNNWRSFSCWWYSSSEIVRSCCLLFMQGIRGGLEKALCDLVLAHNCLCFV